MSGIVARQWLATPRLLNPAVREAISSDTSLIGNFGLRPVPAVGELIAVNGTTLPRHTAQHLAALPTTERGVGHLQAVDLDVQPPGDAHP